MTNGNYVQEWPFSPRPTKTSVPRPTIETRQRALAQRDLATDRPTWQSYLTECDPEEAARRLGVR
jgi:hypothetical protein